jgi:hypothetical protein
MEYWSDGFEGIGMGVSNSWGGDNNFSASFWNLAGNGARSIGVVE